MKKILSIITTAILLAACTSDNEPGINTQPANFTIDTRGVTVGGPISLNVSGTTYTYYLGGNLTLTPKTDADKHYIAPGTNTLPVYAWGVVQYDLNDDGNTDILMPIIHANPTTAVSWTDNYGRPAAPEIKLAFAPATARVKLAGVAFSGSGTNSAILHGINTPTATTFWEADFPPTLKPANNTNTVMLSTNADDFVQVIPGTVAAGAHMLSITVDGTLHPVVATRAYTFLPGMDYTLNVTITSTGQAVITDTAVQEFATGKSIIVDEGGKVPTGTHIIASEADLIAFRKAVNGGNLTLKALQVADITLTQPWVAIGIYDLGNSIFNYFKGVYNGNGFSISGLKIEATGDYQGLFGYTKDAVLANITIKEPEVIGSNHNNIGALVGYALNTTISHCAVTGGMIKGDGSVGGLVGQAIQTHIADCYTAGTKVIGSSNVGGLVGYNTGRIAACYAADAKVGEGSNYIGGLVGVNSGNITFCYATGTVSSGTNSGSLVGWNGAYGTIASCYAATGDLNLVGKDEGTTKDDCASTTITVWDA
ncbi:fimbrillin family protein, partial [Bacteroides sp. OttesenSCG-928-J23]|nr:fimbrillin family protein [Bacteroides sp. OttesenSCG-928-J23]